MDASNRRKLTQSDLKRMNLPRALWRAKFDLVPDSVKAAVLAFVKKLPELVSKGYGALLYGPTGVGKSGIAAILAKEAVARGMTAFFITVWEMRENIRNDTLFEADTTILDRARAVDLLVLDDMRPSDVKDFTFGISALCALVSSRSMNGKATVVTTSLDSMDGLFKNLPQLLDLTVGTAVRLEVKGPNLREKLSTLNKDMGV